MSPSSYYNRSHSSGTKVDTSRFYGEYHGHRVEHLEVLLPALRESSESLIWTAGDSSLDNKYWFQDHRPAVGAYRQVLDPPTMNADVTYWLNRLAIERAQERAQSSPPATQTATASAPATVATINTAVEATTLNERSRKIRVQDAFIRDNILPRDTLVVSIGGNDVALAPTPCTICSMLSLVTMPGWCLEPPVSCICGSPPCNEHCCGCGPVALAACGSAMPPCLGYMNHLFGSRVKHYIDKLTSKTKPKRVLVCMIYYLDETATPSWAGPALQCLGYDSNPSRLQSLIRRMYADATSKIQLSSTHIIPVPLFEVLDGKNSEDYVARVEPSSQGGRKMAEYILDIIERDEQQISTFPPNGSGSTPVESSYMLDRS